MMKWYVLQVLSSHEKRVKKALEENKESRGVAHLIDQVVLPIEHVSEVKRGQHRVVEKRIWPGYLFIRMELNDDSWMYAKNTNGVVGFAGGDAPRELSDEEVETLLSDLANKEARVTQKHKFEIGDRVKITEGVFVNFVGNVIEVHHDKGRLSVMVSIFGRDTRVDDLEFWQVEECVDDPSAGG